MLNPIQSRAVFQRLLFAQCFEDPEIDRRALRIGPGHTVLCVTSGGCNVLALLLDAPAHLIALDLNPAQNALLQLKIEGIRRLVLEHEGVEYARARAHGFAQAAKADLEAFAPCEERETLALVADFVVDRDR